MKWMGKTILLKINTGFCGATHEDEVEYIGQSTEEIQELLNDFHDDVVQNYLEAEYEIEDDYEDE